MVCCKGIVVDCCVGVEPDAAEFNIALYLNRYAESVIVAVFDGPFLSVGLLSVTNEKCGNESG